jgi:predicted RNA binding protein YcfA (HicA-like mRNA interferase family)
MKRKDLIKHLNENGCVFIREGARHSVFFNPSMKKLSTVPRHSEINGFLSKKICRDLGIDIPQKL